MPLSKAVSSISLAVAKSSTSPKLCHNPNERAGNSMPLFPHRLYLMNLFLGMKEFKFNKNLQSAMPSIRYFLVGLIGFSVFGLRESKVLDFRFARFLRKGFRLLYVKT